MAVGGGCTKQGGPTARPSHAEAHLSRALKDEQSLRHRKGKSKGSEVWPAENVNSVEGVAGVGTVEEF